MRHTHRMPFGAAVEDGAVRFRLWAPGARNVVVALGAGGERTQVLASIEDHWFEAVVPDVGAGTRYAFRIDGTSTVADPASRFNPYGVQAASAVLDPAAYD